MWDGEENVNAGGGLGGGSRAQVLNLSCEQQVLYLLHLCYTHLTVVAVDAQRVVFEHERMRARLPRLDLDSDGLDEGEALPRCHHLGGARRKRTHVHLKRGLDWVEGGGRRHTWALGRMCMCT